MPPRALVAGESLGDDSAVCSPQCLPTGFDCNGDERESEADLTSSAVLVVVADPARVLGFVKDTALCTVWGDPYGRLVCMQSISVHLDKIPLVHARCQELACIGWSHYSE